MAKVLLAPTIEGEPRAYRDFVIRASVLSAPNGCYRFTVAIHKHSERGTSSHRLPQSNASFLTPDEAEAAAIRLGQQIIDGAIPGQFV